MEDFQSRMTEFPIRELKSGCCGYTQEIRDRDPLALSPVRAVDRMTFKPRL